MVRRDADGVWATLRETISAHAEEVFACLTTVDGLTRWFPVAAEIDLRPGGGLVLGWDAKFFRRLTVRIADYDAGGRVTWTWPVGIEGDEVRVSWTVEPDVEAGAKVIMRSGPYHESTDALMALADDLESWRWYLCNLRTVLESRIDMRAVRPL